MRTVILFFIFLICNILGQDNGIISRYRRGTAGALEIITNNAKPIHADVKSETNIDKPCPTYLGNTPSFIESGVVFQVTPPKDTVYDGRSLRKSLPLTTKLDLVRAISRVVTLVVLFFSAVLEFYPVVMTLYNVLYEFINFNKY